MILSLILLARKSISDPADPLVAGLSVEPEDSETNARWGQSWIFHGARFRSLCLQLFGTRDGLATRYAGQGGGCAGLASCLAGGRRTSSGNANAQVQVIPQRISDQFLERCSAHTTLVVELGSDRWSVRC